MNKTITTSIRIDASPEDIWAVLTDGSRYSEWNPFITRLDGHLAIGEPVGVSLALAGQEGETFWPVMIHLDPPHQMAWRTQVGEGVLFEAVHSFRIDPVEKGTCLFTHAESYRGLQVESMQSMFAPVEAGFRLMNRALLERVHLLAAGRLQE